MNKTKAQAKLPSGLTFDCLRSTLIAIIFSTIGILALGLIIKFASLDDKFIAPIDQIIKVLSILLGSILGIKTAKSGLLKGIFIGALFAVVSYVAVAAAENSFSLSFMSVIDLAASVVTGGLCGVIAVNIRAKNK